MAEFKLGRIRFVYQGAWTATTQYLVDDVVSVGGKTYICVISHTASASFTTDLTALPTKWNLVADGTRWRGDWQPSTAYILGDQVKWGGTVYVCKTAHTSATYTSPSFLGLEVDFAKWDEFATTFSWKGSWATSTRYKLRDIVSYGGITYVCNLAHISAASATDGLEDDLAKWDPFNEGFTYKGQWSGSSERYKQNDVVTYGADLWLCTTYHTSSATFDNSKWTIFVEGLQFENSWNSSTTYQPGDVVTYGGYSYIATQNHSNQVPSTATAYWDVYTTGFNFRSDWQSVSSYKVGDVVLRGGYTYLAVTDSAIETFTATETFAAGDSVRPNQVAVNSTAKLAANLPIVFAGSNFGGITAGTQYYVKAIFGLTHITLSTTPGGPVLALTAATGTLTGTTDPKPPFEPFWKQLNSGVKWNPYGASYTGLTGTNTVGTGLNATFNVVRANTAYSVTVNVPGTGYQVNDKIKILGTALGGISPANDIIITVTGAAGGVISSISHTGISVTWNTGTAYVLGDVTFFGASSYICTKAHIADTPNRPDNDTQAEYWNLLASGSEPAVLTTPGDTFYYGPSGPTRLPIGTDGQVLRVDNGYPSWSYYGVINNVVYVSPAGTDGLASDGWGLTIDKPWKTVQHAAQQVEKGYLNSSATALLAKNKQFLMKEITNYINYKYSVAISAASSATNRFTTTSTTNLSANMPIRFSGTTGGVTAGTTYYVLAVVSSTEFTITATSGGVVAVTLSDSTTPMTGTLAYDQVKCERDTGLIVDAVIFDVGHGGNAKSTTAALSYYTETGNAYITSNFGLQKTQTIDAYDYLKTLVGNVLSNTAPAQNYQTLNSVSPAAQQIVDTSLVAEENSTTLATSLISIVTNGIYAGTTSAIATAVQPNTTISVKTGTFNEVLPIVLPAGTAIVGDELRSTVIQPSPAIPELVNDIRVSVSALGHVRGFAANLVTNQTITPVTGNTIPQVTTLPAGNIGSLDAFQRVVTNTALIRDILENGLTRVPAFVLPTPTGYNSSLTNVAYASTGNLTGSTANYGDGRAQIVQNYNFIRDEIAAFITVNGDYELYDVANQQKTLRDIGFILDAIQYDITYGGNRQSLIAGRAYYSNGIRQIRDQYLNDTLSALNRLKTIIGQIVTKAVVSPTAGNTTLQVTSGTAGSAGAATFAQARVQDVIDWINNGTANATVDSYKAGASAALQASHAKLLSKRSEIAADAVVWIKKFYQSTAFDEELAARDSGDIVDALAYDLLYGSNFNSLTAGRRYLAPVVSAQVVVNTLLEETSRSINFIGWKSKMIAGAGSVAQAASIIDDIAASISGVVTTSLTAVTTSTNRLTVTSTEGMFPNMPVRITGLPGGGAGGVINNRTYWVNTVVNGTTLTITDSYQSGTPFTISASVTGLTATAVVGEFAEVNGTLDYDNTLATIQGAEVLRANANFIAYETLYHVKTTFGGNVESVTSSNNRFTTSAAHNLKIGDPVKFIAPIFNTTATAVTSTGNWITLASTTGLVAGMPIVFGGTAFGNLVSGTTYYINSVGTGGDAGKITIATSPGSLVVFNPGTASGAMTVVAGGLFGGVNSTTRYWVLDVPTSTTFTLTLEQGSAVPFDITSDLVGKMTVEYYLVDREWLDKILNFAVAIVNDLQYTGNYRSERQARLYNSAVVGSQTENMFLVSNGSGLRNCTLSGLTGTLSPTNSFGTKRPTGGAYVSLNPGFGPNDRNAWVSSRSHYSQNVTMFGSNCTGAKIDGALHAGGNRSMVKNDFTTILSDGIGVWCTGANSLTELVSVFNYYGYAGYLAELGGRIRATNGNSSYGTYGVIAEGVDTYEQPIYARLDNRSAQAQITNVITDGTNRILRFEYGNAGSNYTNTVHSISGAGYNAAATADEFRDASVFETRIVDLNDGNGVGGTSYATQTNVAQGGDRTSVTIAATDTALSTAYVGMRVQITAGTGVGQYANILSYNNGNKLALVYKDSFTNITVTGSDATANTLTVASTATLFANMPIYLSADIGGATANTLYYVLSVVNTTTFTISTSVGGPTFDITATTTGQTVTLYAAGWDHVIPGSTISNSLDLTSVYLIEPRISYTDPGFTRSAMTMNTTQQWNSATYGAGNFVATTGNGTATSYSTTGTTWVSAGALPTSSQWSNVVYGGGEGATATAIIGGLGGQGAVLEAVLGTANTLGLPTANQVASVRIVNGGFGYTTPPTIVFTPVSGGTGAVATCTVRNGKIASVTVSIPGSGYNAPPTVAAIINRLTGITVGNWGKNYYTTPTVTISAPFSATVWTSGGGATSGNYYSFNNSGTTNYYRATTSGTFGSSGPTHTSGSVANGGVTLQYSGTLATATPIITNAGISGYTITDAGSGYTATPTVTILDGNAKFVVVSTNSNSAAYQTIGALGSAWQASGSTSKTDLAALSYGNGVYAAIGGTASAVSSTDGITWISRTIPTLGAGTYSALTYGNGYFIAVATGSNATAVSTNGVSWAVGGNLPQSTTWTSVAYGNGRFVAIASGGRVTALSIDNGATWSSQGAGLPTSATWATIRYAQGIFFAVASGSNACATSPDGINWTAYTMPSSSNWKALAFGTPGALKKPTWISISNTSGTIGAVIYTGARALGRMTVRSGVVTEVRMIEPGSGYPVGSITATTASTDVITTNDTTNLVANQPVEFVGLDSYGLSSSRTYYIISGSIVTNTSFQVSLTSGSLTPVQLTDSTGLTTASYKAAPIVTQTDPNRVKLAALRSRVGNGVLGNPSFSNRGLNNTTATAVTQGDGYGDLYQPSTFISVSGLFEPPIPGANVEFASIPNTWFKLVSVTNVLGTAGNYTATFQINPALTVFQAPEHNDQITTRIKYSQVRLTGHDFLYIGTGNQADTNYPEVDPTTANQANQQLSSGGGRVFFTSTDQDGNFNVGGLFGVQQATGTATLNASAFNLAGLQSLQLGAVSLGIGSAVINQFSTDPYFTANSDNVVPTQRAIRAYITSQIGGGASSLNVNTLTAGTVFIAGNSIGTTTGGELIVNAKMNFTGGIDGAPVALGFFLQR